MSKTVVGLIAAGATTVAVAGGGIIAYNQLSNSNNSNTNSNIATTNSNTKETKSIRNELLGTWIQTNDPKVKIEFTADEMIRYNDQNSEKTNYKMLCGQFMEIKDSKSDAVSINKFTIEGDELTIFTTRKETKFKRESSNTAANTTDTTDVKTEEVTLNKKDLVGTWIDTEKPEHKYIFTEDQITFYNNDQQTNQQKYKIPCGQVVESTDERGVTNLSKVTIESNEMTIHRSGAKSKLRREGGNAANETVDENLTEEVKVFKHKLTGTWKRDRGKIIFTNDGKFLSYDRNGNLNSHFSYRFIDDQTVEWNAERFTRLTAEMTFKDDNKTLVWKTPWAIFNFNLESENADVDLGDSLKNNVNGNWVGIAGTNSANERISVNDYLWARQGNGGFWNTEPFSAGSDGTVNVFGLTYKVTVADDVMTIEADDGMTPEVDIVVKKYNRLKTVVN